MRRFDTVLGVVTFAGTCYVNWIAIQPDSLWRWGMLIFKSVWNFAILWGIYDALGYWVRARLNPELRKESLIAKAHQRLRNLQEALRTGRISTVADVFNRDALAMIDALSDQERAAIARAVFPEAGMTAIHTYKYYVAITFASDPTEVTEPTLKVELMMDHDGFVITTLHLTQEQPAPVKEEEEEAEDEPAEEHESDDGQWQGNEPAIHALMPSTQALEHAKGS